MRRIIFSVCASFVSVVAHAGFIGGQSPDKIYGSGIIRFGIPNAPGDTCNYYGRSFKFDATTESGRNMLSILLAAKMANKKIDIWYAASSAPGANEQNGCTDATLAILTQIGIKE